MNFDDNKSEFYRFVFTDGNEVFPINTSGAKEVHFFVLGTNNDPLFISHQPNTAAQIFADATLEAFPIPDQFTAKINPYVVRTTDSRLYATCSRSGSQLFVWVVR